jgi:beta-glucanase (GH16 family)
MGVLARRQRRSGTVLALAAVALLLVAGAAWGVRDVAYAGSRWSGHSRPTRSPSKSPTGSPTPSAISSAPAGGQASASAAPTPGATATTPILQEQWASASSPSFDFWPHAGSTVTSGSHDTGAVDGSALRLTLAANPRPSPSGAAEASTKSAVKYGTFEVRAKTADCSAQREAGVVTGLFTYANDGRDHDGDGITDNSEIDIEVLCAQPEVLYLTIWTDFVNGGAQRRVSRTVNVKTGQISRTCYHQSFDDCQALSGTEAQPSTLGAHPSFSSATAYHEYGFTWSSTGVRYWVVLDGARVILWDYRGPAQRVPSQPSEFINNVWHTNNWYPLSDRGAVQRPNAPVVACVDWSRVSR